VRTTAKSSYLPTSAPVVALNWALGKVWAGRELPGGATLQHAGHCGKCNRLLTVPESVESGLGPECSGLGYTKPRNVRKPRQPKLTAAQKFERDRNAVPQPLNPAEFTLGAPAAPRDFPNGATNAEFLGLDLGGLYSDNLAGFYAAAAAEDSVDRAERALGVQ
jgi:hypothetical protein